MFPSLRYFHLMVCFSIVCQRFSKSLAVYIFLVSDPIGFLLEYDGLTIYVLSKTAVLLVLYFLTEELIRGFKFEDFEGRSEGLAGFCICKQVSDC